MDFQPESNGVSRLVHLLEEILSEKLDGEMAGRKPEAGKMSFNIFKQREARGHNSLRWVAYSHYHTESSDNHDGFTKFYSFEESVMDLQRSLQDFSNSVQVRHSI